MTVNPWNPESVVLQELITNCRCEAQLTQQQVAKILGKPQSYVSKYESGERKLTLPEIRMIVELCGSNLPDFAKAYLEELKLADNK